MGWKTHTFFIVLILFCLGSVVTDSDESNNLFINDNSSNINIRSGSGKDFPVIGKLKPKEVTQVVGRNGDWVKVRKNNKDGYVFGDLLTEKEPASEISGNAVLILILLIISYVALFNHNKKKLTKHLNIEHRIQGASIQLVANYGNSYYGDKIPKTDANKLWIPPGKHIDVQGVSIDGGNIYVGSALSSASTEYVMEASLINPNLKINRSSPDYEGRTMGYWPSFSEITPEARAAYLQWLGGPRDSISANIGYVFLYFYGIERRLLIDIDIKQFSAEEVLSLLSEVRRLLSIYSTNGSFNSYASEFIDFVLMRYFQEKITEDDIQIRKSYDVPSLLKFQLGKYALEGKPVPPKMALYWLDTDPETRLRVPAHRCRNEFKELFFIRYKENFGEGIVIKPNKTTLTIGYRPASPSLNSLTFTIDFNNELPDVARATSHIKKIRQLGEGCVEELDAYSRYLGSKNAVPGSINAEAFLPKPLLKNSKNSKLTELKNWLAQHDSDFNAVSTKELLTYCGLGGKDTITKKEAEGVSLLLEKLDYGYEPDVRYHGIKVDPKSQAILFSTEGAAYKEPEESFVSVSLLLRLGAIVAHADGTFCQSEKLHLSKLIDQQVHLNDQQKKRLHAYLEWHLLTSPNMAGLKNKFSSLENAQKNLIAEIMLQTAHADGVVDPGEIKQLEKIYKMLGLESSTVIEHLHTYRAANTEPVVIQEASTDQTGFKIPDDSSEGKKEFALDINKIGLIEQDTEQLQKILKPIFADENKEVEDESNTPKPFVSDIQGLNNEHAGLFHFLIAKKDWSKEEIDEQCKKLGLMVDGALETLNEFALDKTGEQLIEEYDGVFSIELETTKELLK